MTIVYSVAPEPVTRFIIRTISIRLEESEEKSEYQLRVQQ
jgi:hypothetical protein